MTLFSNRPVRIKSKRTRKLIDRWYYIDIDKALDSGLDRVTAIMSLNQNRIKTGFGVGGILVNCSTPEKEYEFGMFPISHVFQYAEWRQNYSKYWNYNPLKLELRVCL